MSTFIALSLLILCLVVAGLWFAMGRRSQPHSVDTPSPSPASIEHTVQLEQPMVPSASLTNEFFTLLLRNQRHNLQDHSRLLSEFNRDWQQYLSDPTLFPRQPMILPRLLQAMKSDQHNSQALVQIVLEDPGLTADVLKLANSPIYRNSNKEVSSIDYALVMLGIEGLQSLVCSSLMKPIFAKRRGDGFNSSVFWDWALASAQGAEWYAKQNQVAEPARVYMLALLTRLAELVILRICFRQSKALLITATAEAVLPVIEHYRTIVTHRLIQEWGFDEAWFAQSEGSDNSNCAANQAANRAQNMAAELGSACLLVAKQQISLADAQCQLKALDNSRIDLADFVKMGANKSI